MQERAFCPICESRASRVLARLDEAGLARYLAYSRKKYDGLLDSWVDGLSLSVLQCDACAHAWLSHQPEEKRLFEMYAAASPLRSEGELSREPAPEMVKEMRRLRRFMPSGGAPTLLDFGSGFGRWSRAAVAEGFRVTAYEPSAARGREEGQVDFELVNDREALGGRQFDIINLEQVLEHVPEPVQLLRLLKTYAHERTVLRVTVPNLLRAPEGRDLWTSWPFDGVRVHTMAPFEHLQGFSPFSLREAACRAGFKSIGVFRRWLHYPLWETRALVSCLWPSCGTTFLLLSPGRRSAP